MSNWHLPGQTIDDSAAFSLPVLFPQLAYPLAAVLYYVQEKGDTYA